MLSDLSAALGQYVEALGTAAYWHEHGWFLHTRWGVLWFLAAVPLVWVFQFLAPRRWWLVFLSLISLAFIAFALMPWPLDGILLPGGAAVSWQERAALGVAHAVLVVTLLAGTYALARAAERRCTQAGGRVWRPLLVSVAVLAAGLFGLLLVRTAVLRVHPAYAAEAWLLLPDFHEAGLAYVFVKAVHYVWDSCRGRIHNRGWWRFLAWMTFFPSFRVGPIERFHDFHTQILRCHRHWRLADLAYGTWRITVGVAKGLLAYFIYEQVLHGPDARGFRDVTREQVQAAPYLGLWVFVWLWLLIGYALLAGYTDIAVGLARLIGYRMVENFRWVFFSHNLFEVWHRAHISMSRCLRDYCYYPLVRRGPFRRRPVLPGAAGELRGRLVPTLNYYITFIVCGLWHAPGWNAVVWAMCVGFGMMVLELWTWFWQRRATRDSRVYRLLCRLGFAGGGLLGRVAGIILTLNFVGVTLLALYHVRLFALVATELVRRPLTWIF